MHAARQPTHLSTARGISLAPADSSAPLPVNGLPDFAEIRDRGGSPLALFLESMIEHGFAQGSGVPIRCAITLRGGGLVAPALPDVSHQSLDIVAREFADLVKRARAATYPQLTTVNRIVDCVAARLVFS